jgi:hypothetical protein
VDVIGTPPCRQGIETALAGLAVEQGGGVDRVGIEQVQKRADGALELGEPVLVGPPGDPITEGAAQEVGRLAGGQRRLGFGKDLLLRGLDDLDLFAGLLLEGRDDLADRLFLLWVEALLPPDHEVCGPRAERRQKQRGDDGCDQSLHDCHSARICLIRAIASSTACSGLMPSAATRCTAFGHTFS